MSPTKIIILIILIKFVLCLRVNNWYNASYIII